MSVEAITWALKQDIRPSSAKFVLVVLANQANAETGAAYPSQKYLSESTGQDRKTVIKNLARLSEMGFISDTGRRVGRTKQVSEYRLNIDGEAPAKAVAKGPKNGTVKGSQKRDPFSESSGKGPKNGTLPMESIACIGKGPKNGTVKGSQKRDTEPRAIKNKSKNKSKSKSKSNARDELALPDWLCPDDWRDWCEHRRAGRAAFTPRAQQLSLRTLTRLRDDGHDPTEVIELAIERGWRGLFAPRSETPNGGNHATHRESNAERVARINADPDDWAPTTAGNVIEGSFRAR